MSIDAEDLLREIWGKIPDLATQILGSEVKLGSPQLGPKLEKVDGMYAATLEDRDSDNPPVAVVCDVPSAVACSGLLVMMQEKIIREKMAAAELAEDDLDAMGECVNQITGCFNEVFRDSSIGVHLVFREGKVNAGAALDGLAEEVLCIGGSINIGELHEGEIWLAFPPSLLDVEAKPEEPEVDDVGGVQLTAEEAEALREATREGFATVDQSLVFLLPISRERKAWQEALDQSDLTYTFASDIGEVRKLCRSGQAGAVVLDADASPSGGLPALASLVTRAEVGVPVLMAASRPTRTHLVSCLAAGAATYMVKPVAVDQLRERVDEVLGAWRGQHP